MEDKFYKLLNKENVVVCQKMAIANSFRHRLMGLMFTEKLPSECDGFLISPCQSIHTFFMRYSLDVIFLTSKFEVVKVFYNLSPWKLTWVYFKSSQVVELKAGTLIKEIKVGDKLEAICLK